MSLGRIVIESCPLNIDERGSLSIVSARLQRSEDVMLGGGGARTVVVVVKVKVREKGVGMGLTKNV